MSRVPARLGVAAVSAVVLFLVVEGAYSLSTGRSLRRLWRGSSFLERIADAPVQMDADRFAAAAREPGPYRIHEDPRVAYVLKSSTTVQVGGVDVRTDDLGLRVRLAGEPGPDARKVLVLGDSVAFGWGLAPEEVLSEQLERILSDAQGPGAPEVAVRCVAIPSWNQRNAFQFVLDHLDRLRPSVVLWLHVANDLNDSFGVYETGHRRSAPDFLAPKPWVHVEDNTGYFKHNVVRLEREGLPIPWDASGPSVIEARLTTTSRLLVEDMARSVVRFRDLLAGAGARLALVPYVQHEVHRELRAELALLGEDVPVLPLLSEAERDDTQVTDPHPSAATVRAFAVWLAESLLERTWVAGGARALPEVEPRYRGRRATELTPAGALGWREQYERSARARLQSLVEHESLTGTRQIFGGVLPDGRMGPEMLAALPPGRRLEITLAPMEDRPDLYPQSVEVWIDDVPIAEFEIERGGPAVGEVPLRGTATERPFEVWLRAERSGVVDVLGKSQLASARFVSLRVLSE